MYNVVGDDGALYPADLNALTEWAQIGRIRPDSIILDGATGRRLRADEFLALQPVFAARQTAPPRPATPINEIRPFSALPEVADSGNATPKTARYNAGRNTAIGCLGFFAVLLFVGCLANLGSQAPSSTATPPGVTITPPPTKPLTAAEKKKRADAEKQATLDAKKAAKKAEAARLAEAEHQRRAERAAQAEVERKAREEYEENGLVLMLKSLDAERGEYSAKIRGTVVNRTGHKLSYAQIQFNLYDSSGAQVGTALANINNLEDGG